MVLPSEGYVQLKEIGWNGIRISLPQTWHPAAIAPFHLLFEDDNGPTMELRWHRARQEGKTLKAIYRQLSQTAKSHRCGLQKIPLPKAWQKALKQYKWHGFFWQSQVHSAHGVVISCPQCRLITLLQFFHPPETPDHHLFAQILATFRDHVGKNAMTCWAIYDIRVELPKEYCLSDYNFDAGTFHLNFKRKTTKVTLYRFAPASLILTDLSLGDFSKNRWPTAPQKEAEEISQSENWIEYRTVIKDQEYRQLLARCLGRKKEAWVRVRHLKRQNRIHAVRVESDHHYSRSILSTVADTLSHV